MISKRMVIPDLRQQQTITMNNKSSNVRVVVLDIGWESDLWSRHVEHVLGPSLREGKQTRQQAVLFMCE